MDARLISQPASSTARSRRRRRFALLVAAVALAHVAATRELAERMAAFGDDADAMPARIEVAYVRTLERAAPVPAAVAPRRETAPAAREPRPAARAGPAASAASAPSPAASDPGTASATDTALAPLPQADAASAVGADAVAGADSAIASDPAASSVAAASIPDTAMPTSPAASPPAFALGGFAPAGAEPFAWPRATRVRYTLTGNYRGEVSGSAEVEWIRTGERYQVNVDLVVGPSFAPILARRATSEGRLTEAGLAPDRYDESSRFMFRDKRHFAVIFWPDSVVLANGQRRERLPGVQDSASQFIQFSWLFGVRPDLLRVGNTFEVPLALPRSLDRWTYDVQDAPTLDTAFGPVATFHLRPRRAVRKPNEVAVEMWLAPELRFLPVRIRFEQDASTFIDLLISSKPELSG